MGQSNFTKKEAIFDLVSLFEEMSQTEVVQFPTDESYYKLIDYFQEECQLNRALEVISMPLLNIPSRRAFTSEKHNYCWILNKKNWRWLL